MTLVKFSDESRQCIIRWSTSTPVSYSAKDGGWDFASAILASTEEAWKVEFQKMGMQYNEPKLGQTVSDCGGTHSATGSFYDLADKEIYLDRSFFNKLKRRFGVEYNFAPAYVIAHEVGHHVQNMMGGHNRSTSQTAVSFRGRRKQIGVTSWFFSGWLDAKCWQFEFDRKWYSICIERSPNAIDDDKLQEQSKAMQCPTPLHMDLRSSAWSGLCERVSMKEILFGNWETSSNAYPF